MNTPTIHAACRPNCSRCGKKYRGRGPWNMTVSRGIIVGLLCPRCQTPEENAEAEINLATLDYDINNLGRIIGKPKIM